MRCPSRITLRLLFPVAIGVAGLSQLQAQQPFPPPIERQLVGTWMTEYYRTTGGHGGGGESELARARLTLAQRGDSVVGQWQDLVATGAPTPRSRALRGVIRDGALTLVADSVTAVMRQHLGPERRLQMVITYELAVRGDSLVGTQRMRSTDGAINNNPRRFVAVRERP